jgi:hypothetical protein
MTVKSLLVKFGVDVSEFNSGMDRMQASLEKHSTQFKSIGIGMMAVGGIMTAFFAKSIDEAAKSEAVQAKLEQALKRTGDTSGEGARKLEGYAKQLSLTTAYSDEEIMSAQALLATYGLTASKIAELTPRVLDLASAHSNETGEVVGLDGAARSLGMAVSGNTTTLQRHGVILAADTKATGDLALVCRDLDKSVGGTAATFGQTFAGQLKIARNQVGEVVEGIGAKLLPLLLPLLQKVVNVAQGIGTWIDAHQGLLKVLVPVLAGLGALLTVSGGILMILPKIVNGAVGVGKAFLFLAANPIVLVVAALAALGLALNSVINSMKAAQDATMNAMVADKSLAQAIEFRDGILKKNIVTQKELTAFCKEYGVTTKGLIDQAKIANELHMKGDGILARLGKAYAEYEKQLKKTKEETGGLSAKQEELQDKLSKGRKEMLDDLVKLTTGEVEMTKRAANEEYQIRKKALDETRAANKKYNDDVVLLNQIRVLKISQAETKARLAEIKRMEDEKKAAKLQADTLIAIALAKNAELFSAEAGLEAQKARMRGDELKALKIELAAELHAKTAAILADGAMSDGAKKEEIARLQQFYADKLQLTIDEASAEYGIMLSLQSGITDVYNALFTNIMGAFQVWGEGSKSLLGAVGDAFKETGKIAMNAFQQAVSAALGAAAREIIASQATAIAKVIASVMALPFPLNLALVGGAIAAVSALFHAIHFAEGGVVTKPTLALIGEAGPEAVVPLRGAGRTGGLAFAGAGMGGQFRITNNFYGDIRSDKDIEKISRAVADQIKRASKHRRL